MNTEKLLKIKKKILANPKQFEMDNWFQIHLDDSVTKPAKCGTAACIVGWWLFVDRGAKTLVEAAEIKGSEYGSFGNTIQQRAKEDLGLPNYKLFFVSGWPDSYREAYYEAVSRKFWRKAVKIVGEVINDYIATNGWGISE
jgi:hypothetical protein